jgi:hypothetical protein
MGKASKLPVLRLVKEHKLHELLGGSPDVRFEASGICARGKFFYVIFDNAPHVARIDQTLTVGHKDNELLRQRGESVGFEDVTFHEGTKRFLIIIEALPFRDEYRPVIEEYDEEFRFIEYNWVDFKLPGGNKGLEGLSYVRRGDEDYVLGICEGNKCKSGKAGRKPGGGRIQVFQKGKGQWNHVGTLKLPKSVRFEDYASLRVEGNRIAVVSQMTSALWIGRLSEKNLELIDDGETYLFPRDEKGRLVYCNIEGVAWVTPSRLVVVSDKRKPGEQPKCCRPKDQSIHVFDLPRARARANG